MANSQTASQTLGENILALRKKRELSQARLSRLAEIPRSTLTHIESGEGNPSLSNLIKISSALQIQIEELLTPLQPSTELKSAADIPCKVRVGAGVKVFQLLPKSTPGLEMDRIELEPGGLFKGTPHLQGTKEYLTVNEGQIKVYLEGAPYLVKKGDFFSFPGDRPHSYRNIGKRKASAISVVILHFNKN